MFKPTEERPVPGLTHSTNMSIVTGVATPSEAKLAAATIDELIDHLHTLLGREKPWNSTSSVDRHSRIVHIVRHLVVQRRQRLTPFMYECIAATLSDPTTSGRSLVNLVKDMAQQGLEPTQAFYASALESLTVHPNYTALLAILEATRARGWPESRQTVAVALLRDEQYELALDTLMELHAGDARVEPWVYDVFVFVLGRMGFVEAMMEVLAARLSLDATHGLHALQYYALDVCSAAFHYPGTLAGWNSLVRGGASGGGGAVNPSDGIVENVLMTAAREVDTVTASEALDMLAQRTRLQDYHYETLIDAFLADGDLASAARLHCIMHTSGVPATEAAVQLLLTAVGDDDGHDEIDAWLRSAADEKLLVPAAFVHAAISSRIRASDSAGAVDLYGRYEALCGEDADPPLDVLLQLVPHGGDLDTVAALCDRIVEKLEARSADEDVDALLRQCDAAVAQLVQQGKTRETNLVKEKLRKVQQQKPQIAEPS